MGRAHLAVDEVVEALGALKSGFGIDCRNAEIAMLLGLVALDLDDERTADRAFSAIATMPSRKEPAGDGLQPGTKAIAYYHLASMAYLKGDLGKTRRLATKAIGEDSGHQAAQALLEKADVRVGTAAARNAAKSPATPA
jgi:hypothetical protein